MYVTHLLSGTVSVLDAATGAVTKTLSGLGVPWDVVVSPDGTTAYVSNVDGGTAATVSVINTATRVITATVSDSADTAFSLAVDGVGRPYVAADKQVFATDGGAAPAVVNTFDLAAFAGSMTADTIGSRLYVAARACLGCIAVSADPWDATSVLGGSLNAAVAVGNRNRLGANPIADIAGGPLNFAAVIGARNVTDGTYATISGKGNRNLAVNIGTTNTNGYAVQVGAPGKPANSSVAFDLAGGRRLAGNNLVNGQGDQAVAGAIGQTGTSVSQSGPGRTIRRGASAAAGGRQPGRL